MRNKVAKRLRREAGRIAYKTNQPTKLAKVVHKITGTIFDKYNNPVTYTSHSTVVFSGWRRIYQDLKEAYYARSYS